VRLGRWVPPRPWRFGRAYCSVVAGLGISLALVIGTVADRSPPIDHIEGAATPSVVHPGGWLEGAWTINVLRLCPGTLTRWIESGSSPDWFEWQPDLNADLQNRVRAVPKLVTYPVTSFRLPPDMPPGPASYHVVGYFRCNFIGHLFMPIVVVYPPLLFTVEK
jgi:hypothetical protein